MAIKKFSAMLEEETLDYKVVFVCSTNLIFSNWLSDRISKSCSADIGYNDRVTAGESTEFTEYMQEDKDTNRIPLEQFVTQSSVPSLFGTWYCIVRYDELTKREINILEKYLLNINSYGKLIVIVNDWRKISELRRKQIIKGSEDILLAEVSYPLREELASFIMAETEGVDYIGTAFKLVMLLAYNNYGVLPDIIERLKEVEDKKVDYETAREVLKGIDNFHIDNLLQALLVACIKHDINIAKDGQAAKYRTPSNKVYKVIAALEKELPYSAIVRRLIGALDIVLDIRMAANMGKIPIGVPISTAEIRDKVFSGNKEGDKAYKYKTKNISDFKIRKYAEICKMVSVKEITVAMQILSVASKGGYFDEIRSREQLLKCVNRKCLSANRILNNVGYYNDIDKQLYFVNGAYLYGLDRKYGYRLGGISAGEQT